MTVQNISAVKIAEGHSRVDYSTPAKNPVIVNTTPVAGEFTDNCQPALLLDTLIGLFDLETDADLARMLGVNRSIISRIRHKKRKISAELLLAIHEMTHISIGELRKIMGDTKGKYFSGSRSSDTF